MTLPLVDFPDDRPMLGHGFLDRVSTGATVVAPGAEIAPGVADLRNFASVVVDVLAAGPAIPTAFNRVGIYLRWFADAALSQPTWQDTYFPWAQELTAGAFFHPGGEIFIQDSVRGAFLQLRIRNEGADNEVISFDVYGGSSELTERGVRDIRRSLTLANQDDEVLIDSLGAVPLAPAAVATYVTRMHIGQSWWRLEAAASAHNFVIFDSFGNQVDQEAIAAGGITRREIILPARSLRVTVTNTGGVAGTHRINVIGKRQPV